jgi:hypothetical protein
MTFLRIAGPAVAVLAVLASGPALADHRERIDARKCNKYGFQTGSAGFANCMLQLETNRSQMQAAATHAQGLRDAAATHAQATVAAAAAVAASNAAIGGAGQGTSFMPADTSFIPPSAMVSQGSTQPPPAYDRYGMANYDQDGNYIGAHGIGTLVDNPDVPGDPAALVEQDQADIDAAAGQ